MFSTEWKPYLKHIILPSRNHSEPPATLHLGQTGGAATYCSQAFADDINHSLQTENCLIVKETCEKCIKKTLPES